MWRTLMVAGVALLIASCGGVDSYEDAVNAQTEIMMEMLEILEGVDDEASAEKAAGRIEALGTQLAEIAKQMQEMPRPSIEELQEIGEQQRARTMEIQQKAVPQMMKLAQYPALREAWTRAFQNIG
ncbi:MAG: hypothetical protein QNJ73_03205 [Gammaproteobacteria bacterium]|nr:hypothetical protein [Gammaproteobacteria bacterium]